MTVNPPLFCSAFVWFAHTLNWLSHVRCAALLKSVNVLPPTSNGREELPDCVIGGAALPSDPVKVCRLDTCRVKIVWWGIENRDGVVEVEVGGKTVRRVRRAKGRERGEGIVAGREQIDENVDDSLVEWKLW